MKKQKVAILIYPEFSNYEISILAEIFKLFEKEIVVFSAEKNIVNSEEGFHFMPDKSLDEFNINEYSCLVLPGMWSFPKVLNDNRYINFLEKFRDNKDIIIASISSSPILLARAGVLNKKKYCIGLYEEDIDKYDFLDRESILKEPIVEFDNIITALGLAYREFAITVGQKLGLECNDNWFSGIKKSDMKKGCKFYREDI
ncbi:MAG: DJ-1/PfpI family protein [Paraclostridium sordellii]|uniref:DJ-1/PfpI family protein n=1 Tax=Paraclostridium sordellii TaxID=1505 RepID=UPI0005E32DAC|nr:DJ-1/PfpI family protein [Paeniclostridium sordellii]MBS6023626.1 DJ-1/PfpI family protein [Paeniclostridium sordellii]CEN87915.1 putative intracellular protease/amidase [[Clostridium] sordellii] [Paeniclostridium sordellii]CEQ12093.1 putative intracellular protease/amidase [[Clostridium] sordellii] [Paeniclostridium sordellii]